MRDKLRESDLIIINKTTYFGKFAPLLNRIGFGQKTNRNDILVFKKDLKQKDYYIKRCIALPGDRIRIHDGIVSVNNKAIKEPGTVRKSYKIYYNDFNLLSKKIKDRGISLYQGGYTRNASYFNLSLNENQLSNLKNITEIDSITIFRTTGSKINNKVFDLDEYLIPYAGMRILLNDKNLARYQFLITKFENSVITRKMEKVMVNGRPMGLYTFKFGYVFLLGDNRNDSVDSREFGAIPLGNIAGKYILSF